jgi:hypothetical protein
MSKMGSYFMDMQEDAVRMSFQSFVERYGYGAAEAWHDLNFSDSRDREPELETLYAEMDDGA